MNMFRDLIRNDLDKLNLRRSPSNLAFDIGLKKLCENKDPIIRSADKGGSIVILDKADYLQEMSRIFGDRKMYGLLRNNPTCVYRKELTTHIDKGFKALILEKAFLTPMAHHIPMMYYVPKIHKDINRSPSHLMSRIDSITARIGKYIDFYLQTVFKKVPSYLKDTKDTI